MPYVLPVLGGLFGVIYVNLFPKDQINPVFAIGGGALLGWLSSRGVAWLIDHRR